MTKIKKIVAVSEDNDQVEKVVQAKGDEQTKQDSEIEDDECSEEEEQQLNQDNEEDDDESTDENPQIQQQKDDDDDDDAVALSPNKNVKVGVKIFTDEDELLLLKSFITFKSETGVDDHNTFLHAIEGNLTLSFPASHTQLREKVRRFKDKYLLQVARGQTAFKNPHQDMIYRLSHEAFGPGDDQQNDENDDEMVLEQAKEVDHADNYWTLYPKLCRYIESDARVHFLAAYDVKEFVKMLILKLGEKKVKELEEEWKEISVMEFQLYSKRLQVLSKQAKAVVNALRKSKVIN